MIIMTIMMVAGKTIMKIIMIIDMMIIRTLDCCSEEGCGSFDQLMNIVIIIMTIIIK